MFRLILYEPEIPPNTGNIMRLCANTGTGLHLVRPLGFELDDRKLRRAGLDYREFANVSVHDDLDTCLAELGRPRVLAWETRGLPQHLIDRLPASDVLRIPMRRGSRSLNLANAAAVVLYEAWRQRGFQGLV